MTQARSVRRNAHYELLLRAALLEGAEAVDSWRVWNSQVDLAQADHDSVHLIPLIYHNLEEQGDNHSLAATIPGICRKVWYRNRILLSRLSESLQRLHDRDIRTGVLGGAVLALLYYRDYGLRPMEDTAILVQPENVATARATMERLGWVVKPRGRAAPIPAPATLGYRSPEGLRLELRWEPPAERWPARGKGFWEGYGLMEVEGVTTHRMCPMDQLLHLCVEGARRSPAPPPRWVADATMLLRWGEAAIDWPALMKRAERLRLVLPLRESLAFLKLLVAAPVPDHVLEQLEAAPISALERLQYGNGRLMSGSVPSLFFRYWRTSEEFGLPSRLLGYPCYLRSSLGLDRWSELPLHLLSRGAKKLRGSPRGGGAARV